MDLLDIAAIALDEVDDEIVSATAEDVTLAEHDRQYHKDGYREGDSCEFRERRAKLDPVDGDIDENVGICGIYTGSGASYNRPSLIHVGKGEGTQVYGWGLYGSTVRGVADGYANAGKSNTATANSEKIYAAVDKILRSEVKRQQQIDDIYEAIESVGKWDDIETSIIENSLDEGSYDVFKLHKDEFKKIYERLGAHNILYSQTFFTNRAKGDESHLLNWYEPVSAENLKRIETEIEKTGRKVVDDSVLLNKKGTAVGPMGTGMTGQGIYKVLVKAFNNSPNAASQFLARADIDGIKYPVNSYGGKGVKDGNKVGWNYVSFRDDNIRIDKKYVDGIETDVKDAAPTNMEKHDAKYHPDGYEPGDTCKYRKLLEKGDLADAAIDPENVEGEEISRKSKQSASIATSPVSQQSDSSDKQAREIFREWRHNSARSDMWLLRNLGITDHDKRKKAMRTMDGFLMGQIKKDVALKKLVGLSSGLPKDAWKPGKHSGSSSKSMQMLLPSLNLPTYQSNTGALSKYYHAQGVKQYTKKQDSATGLYETKRPGGDALAREEDVPGMTPFHKHRPAFRETGVVPKSLSDAELAKFKYTANGSTYPMVGNVNGRNYIVKHGLLPEGVRRNADLNDHLRHEVAADMFMRAAGLRVPVCNMFEKTIPPPPPRDNIDENKLSELFDIASIYKLSKSQYQQLKDNPKSDPSDVQEAKAVRNLMKDEFEKVKSALGKDYQDYKDELHERVDAKGELQPRKPKQPKTEVLKVAEYVDGGIGLAHAWFHADDAQKQKMRQQMVDAYPILSFLEGVDAAKNDNILVDKDWNLWFVDNGASFDYRAQGGKKLLGKDGDRMATSRDKDASPWYYERQDPTDEVTGYLGLAYAPDQMLLQEILSETSDKELVDAAKKYDFVKLTDSLPSFIKDKPGIKEYAANLNEAVHNPPAGWIDDAE